MPDPKIDIAGLREGLDGEFVAAAHPLAKTVGVQRLLSALEASQSEVERLKGQKPPEVQALVKLLHESEPDHQPDDGATDMTITVDEARRIAWALMGVPTPWPWRDAMNTAWRAVDALGGVGAPDEYARALNEACAEIERLGGRDPDPIMGQLRARAETAEAALEQSQREVERLTASVPENVSEAMRALNLVRPNEDAYGGARLALDAIVALSVAASNAKAREERMRAACKVFASAPDDGAADDALFIDHYEGLTVGHLRRLRQALQEGE